MSSRLYHPRPPALSGWLRAWPGAKDGKPGLPPGKTHHGQASGTRGDGTCLNLREKADGFEEPCIAACSPRWTVPLEG